MILIYLRHIELYHKRKAVAIFLDIQHENRTTIHNSVVNKSPYRTGKNIYHRAGRATSTTH